ncbi:hypothetical protein IJ818_03710 [bacterium]|nr:hypothetical protein [bacterium]
MTREQIIISTDRLTRFKPTVDKYLRVYKDIILNNLIYPSYKKKDLDEMDYGTLTELAQNIFNYSLNELGIYDNTDSFIMNKKLREYENSIFHISNECQTLLKNKISYKSALNLLKPEDLNTKNLLWLSNLDKDTPQEELRKSYLTHFPIQKIIIAEGITEEILLPIFADINGVNFDKYGFHVISAGGKNQVVKLFYSFADILKIPMFVLLDNDAYENIEQINPKIRDFDKIYLVQSGEFEDLLPINLILKTLNNHLKNLSFVDISDFDINLSMVKNLENIYKEKGLEDFKKADFAHLVSENISSKSDLSEEIIKIINELKL